MWPGRTFFHKLKDSYCDLLFICNDGKDETHKIIDQSRDNVSHIIILNIPTKPKMLDTINYMGTHLKRISDQVVPLSKVSYLVS